jgi:hypothetical protein
VAVYFPRLYPCSPRRRSWLKLERALPAEKSNPFIEKRTRYYRRAYARGIGKVPPFALRLALDRASQLAALAEQCRLNPRSTPSAIAVSDRAARIAFTDLQRAKAELRRSIEPPAPGPNDLDAYAASLRTPA